MTSATFTKINDWINNAIENADLDSDTFMIALSNTAPSAESSDPTADGNGELANVTQIAYTNYSDNLTTDRTLEGTSGTSSGGTYTFDSTVDFTITASGGDLPEFRYIYIYDDTIAGDPLVGVWDYGQGLTLLENDSLEITFNANGIFTVA
jgi:hypothetical protein